MDRIRVSLIAAVAGNGVIGLDGRMPWRLSSDLKRFKTITMGKPLVMGRKTFESIGRPLPGRANIVISGNPDFEPEGVVVVPTVAAALDEAETGARIAGQAEIMVIGGGAVYREAIAGADRLYITHVDATPEGDTHFPEIDPGTWQAISEERLPAGPKDSATTRFVIYDRAPRQVSH